MVNAALPNEFPISTFFGAYSGFLERIGVGVKPVGLKTDIMPYSIEYATYDSPSYEYQPVQPCEPFCQPLLHAPFITEKMSPGRKLFFGEGDIRSHVEASWFGKMYRALQDIVDTAARRWAAMGDPEAEVPKAVKEGLPRTDEHWSSVIRFDHVTAQKIYSGVLLFGLSLLNPADKRGYSKGYNAFEEGESLIQEAQQRIVEHNANALIGELAFYSRARLGFWTDEEDSGNVATAWRLSLPESPDNVIDPVRLYHGICADWPERQNPDYGNTDVLMKHSARLYSGCATFEVVAAADYLRLAWSEIEYMSIYFDDESLNRRCDYAAISSLSLQAAEHLGKAAAIFDEISLTERAEEVREFQEQALALSERASKAEKGEK